MKFIPLQIMKMVVCISEEETLKDVIVVYFWILIIVFIQ